MYKVDPEALRTAARDYTECSRHLAITASYHRDPSGLEFFENSILALLRCTHEDFVELLQRRLEEVAAALSGSGAGLIAAATHYETSDADSARVLDQTYPPADRASAQR